MSYRSTSRRLRQLVAVATLALGLGACKDSTGLDDAHGEEVHAMKVTLANGTSVTVSETGTVTGTLTIPAGVATTFTVTFLDDATRVNHSYSICVHPRQGKVMSNEKRCNL